jgi:hypothetical protein
VSSLAWDTIQAAIAKWVTAASGLTAIWTFPGVAGVAAVRPAPPYITMQLDVVLPVGHDWRTVRDADNPQPGAELDIIWQGHRTSRLELQCFSVEGAGNAPLRTLVDVIDALSLHIDDLDAAGVGIGEIGPARLLSGRSGGILEPRSVVELSLHFASEVVGQTTYVERMNITATEPTIGEVANFWVPDPPPES